MRKYSQVHFLLVASAKTGFKNIALIFFPLWVRVREREGEREEEERER